MRQATVLGVETPAMASAAEKLAALEEAGSRATWIAPAPPPLDGLLTAPP